MSFWDTSIFKHDLEGAIRLTTQTEVCILHKWGTVQLMASSAGYIPVEHINRESIEKKKISFLNGDKSEAKIIRFNFQHGFTASSWQLWKALLRQSSNTVTKMSCFLSQSPRCCFLCKKTAAFITNTAVKRLKQTSFLSCKQSRWSIMSVVNGMAKSLAEIENRTTVGAASMRDLRECSLVLFGQRMRY